MNDVMHSEGAVSIQTTGAMGAGIRLWMQLSTFILKWSRLECDSSKETIMLSLSWLYVRDKIARYLYISLLCGRLTQAKWTEPLPIRDLVLFNIAHAQMKQLWTLSISGNDVLVFQRGAFVIHPGLFELIDCRLITRSVIWSNWLNVIGVSL